MASPAKDFSTPTTEKTLEARESFVAPEITHAILLSIVPPIHAIVDKPVTKSSPSVPTNTLHASPSIEMNVPPPKEPAKQNKKRVPKNVAVIPSNNEECDEPNPPPKARKPTPKRRKATPKKPSTEPFVQTPPTAKNPQGEASDPQEGTPKPNRKRASIKKATLVAATSSKQILAIEKPSPIVKN
ncbi:extensin-like [Cryptomeria japonica]|uniref:extensin-like n=1 Tax=Cryptomeria japonica TaxID=3369 RepID=UPI0027D9FF7B|nr:extensin-like [Cryptomeria japonica]